MSKLHLRGAIQDWGHREDIKIDREGALNKGLISVKSLSNYSKILFLILKSFSPIESPIMFNLLPLLRVKYNAEYYNCL